MATIKVYADLGQSKKLAKILPAKSADMRWVRLFYDNKPSDWKAELGKPIKSCGDLPCWSLAALLDVLPYGYSFVLTKSFNGKHYGCKIDGRPFESQAGNSIDACYEMIIHLNELNLL